MNHLLIPLQKSSLFKGKSLDEIKYLLSNIIYKIKSFEKNESIYPNQIADTMGIILSGSVHVHKLLPSGKIVILARRNNFDLIAEPAIFANIKYYPASLSTCKPCKILFIHKDEVLKLLSLDKMIMLNFLEAMSDAMLILKYKIGNLSLNSIQERIADFLIHSYKTNSSNKITLPFSKKDWAEYMNVSRPSLSRELNKLKIDGIISFNKRTIEIKKLERLKKILYKIE